MGANWLFEPKRWETGNRSQNRDGEMLTKTILKKQLGTGTFPKRRTCQIKLEHEYDVDEVIPENVMSANSTSAQK